MERSDEDAARSAAGSCGAEGRLSPVESLLLRHAERIKLFLHALLRDADLAEDLFQEVFITAIDKAADFQEGTDFLAWVRAIARNKVLDALRRERRRSRRQVLLQPATLDALAAAAPVVDIDWDPYRLALRRCLAELPRRLREFLRLRYADDLSPAAIASAQRVSANVVSVTLHRGRQALQGCIRRRLAQEGRE